MSQVPASTQHNEGCPFNIEKEEKDADGSGTPVLKRFKNVLRISCFEMSMRRCTDELHVQAEKLFRTATRDVKHYVEFWKQVPPTEPYCVILGDVRDKLYKTRERAPHLLAHDISDVPEETN